MQKSIGGITFEDPFHDLHADTQKTKAWDWEANSEAQALAQSCPAHEALLAEYMTGAEDTGPMPDLPRRAGGWWFWIGLTEEGGQGFFVGEEPMKQGRLLFDIKSARAKLNDEFDRIFSPWWQVARDGTHVGIMTATPTMAGEWWIVRVEDGEVVSGPLPRPAYNGAFLGFTPDGGSFYLPDRDASGHHVIRRHRVDAEATVEAERVFDFTEIPTEHSGLGVDVSPNGRWVICVSKPHQHIAQMVCDTLTGEWRRVLPKGWQGEAEGAWLDDDIYVARVHDGNQRGRVVAIPMETSRNASTWREIVGESEAVLRAATVIEGHVIVCDSLNVSSRFRVCDLEGNHERVLDLPRPGSSSTAYILRSFASSESLVVDYQSFFMPTAMYACDVATGSLNVLGKMPQPLTGYAVDQRFADSTSGARVPYYLVYREGHDLTRPAPSIVHGYGGFNVALLPTFLAHWAPFIRSGGVFVLVNLRGGAEFGDEWHQAGALHNKQHTFDDLFAIAEALIDDGISNSDVLAMQGASNGGLLAGVAAVQRPDLWRITVPMVPIFDQMEPFPEGDEYAPLRAIWLQEYGDPQDPEDAPGIYAYSPYHQIQEGESYPTVYTVFGEHDIGCPTFHGRKFVSRLRASSSSGHPVHMRVWKGVGHGSQDPKVMAEINADWMAVVFDALGLTYVPAEA